MTDKIEKYLTAHKDGYYIFNYNTPQALKKYSPNLPHQIVKPLPTTDYETALKLASALLFEMEVLTTIRMQNHTECIDQHN
jgi:hypothetical protein